MRGDKMTSYKDIVTGKIRRTGGKMTTAMPASLEKICEDIENLHREHYFDWKPTREQLGYRKAQIDIINYLRKIFNLQKIKR